MSTPAPAIVRDLVVAHTRALKLPGVARTFEGLPRQARDSHWSHEDYLHEVLGAEQASRHESVIRQRLREARFPEVETLDTFDFAAADGINATQIHTLARGEWVTAPENLILARPIGTGETHLAIALGVGATRQKRRVLFTRATDLVRQLVEARECARADAPPAAAPPCRGAHRRRTRLRALRPRRRRAAFNLLTDRYERRATVVTTNLAFAEWVTVFAGDEKLATALLDRLAHHATVLTTKGKSYRMRTRRALRDGSDPVDRTAAHVDTHIFAVDAERSPACGRLTLTGGTRNHDRTVGPHGEPRRTNRPQVAYFLSGVLVYFPSGAPTVEEALS